MRRASFSNRRSGRNLPLQRHSFHTDAVQAVGKVDINLERLPINFLSLSGHKLHAPKGVAALYVNRRTRFNPYLLGGGQENKNAARHGKHCVDCRPGSSVGVGFRRLGEERCESRRFETVSSRTFGYRLIRSGQWRPDPPPSDTSSLAIDGVDSEGMLMLLDQRGICCSAGSGCTAGSLEPSHVLKADGIFQ